ncbi:energy-coupling factor transporter transmembrane component T family protein [Flexibacterium corallicola]|uniref:energy-coupling factor transporter transmembrane component T family protein n=1 Tax=Flexibacterium corallicola TaxID=3037259 RepID=UPI00286F02C8|nr:energy-coupling factor transporter transmembrane protein EcfT [Pseudovibrio sp. M1P-2-3]
MISLYLPVNSWAHRLPAGFKLLVLCGLSLVFIPFDYWWTPAVLLAFALALYVSLGKQGVQALKVVRPLFWVMGIMFAFHVFLGTYLEGISVILRLLAMVLLANFVTITTPLEAMMDAAEPVFRPFALIGISSKRLALAVALVLRFIPVLLGVYAGLQEAYFARTGKKNSWRLLSPFILQAVSMTEHVAEALSARGGADGYPRKTTNKDKS